MKGKVKIQVFNNKGELKQEISKNNTITNIESILSPPFYNYFECYNSTKINPLRNYSKLVENFIGGVFLFNSSRDTSKEHMLPNLNDDIKKYIGTAGMNFTGNSSKQIKGTRNLNETKAILDENGKEVGYRFVWDFGTGSSFNLGSLSLCSANAGNHGLNFDLDNDTTTPAEFMGRYNVKLDGVNGNYFSVGEDSLYSNIPASDISKNGAICYISADFKTIVMGTLASNSYTLTKYYFRDNIKLNDNLNSITTDISTWTNFEKDLIYNVTPSSATLQNINNLFWEDNYIYSVYSKKVNNEITIHYVKINVETMSIEEEKLIPITVDGYNTINSYVVIGNKIYINDGDYDKIHIINLDTDTLENTITYTPRDSSQMYLKKLNDDILILTRYGTYIYLIYLDHDNVANSEMTTNRVFGYKTSNASNISPNNFMQIGDTPIFTSRSVYSSKDFINFNLFELFFISNINVSAEKGEEDTLKIIYELTN